MLSSEDVLKMIVTQRSAVEMLAVMLAVSKLKPFFILIIISD